MPRKVRVGGWEGGWSPFPTPALQAPPLPTCAFSPVCPGAHTPAAFCVLGVLPAAESPRAAASGLAPGAECAPGSGARPEAACCGQQAIPHQQGFPAPLLCPSSPVPFPLLTTLASHSLGLPRGLIRPKGGVTGPGGHPDGLAPRAPASLSLGLLPTLPGPTGGPLRGRPGGAAAVRWAPADPSGRRGGCGIESPGARRGCHGSRRAAGQKPAGPQGCRPTGCGRSPHQPGVCSGH